MHCFASTAKWLRERATMLRYTYIAYLLIFLAFVPKDEIVFSSQWFARSQGTPPISYIFLPLSAYSFTMKAGCFSEIFFPLYQQGHTPEYPLSWYFCSRFGILFDFENHNQLYYICISLQVIIAGNVLCDAERRFTNYCLVGTRKFIHGLAELCCCVDRLCVCIT